MDVREKLVELIESARYWGSNTSEEIAEHLISNGVTVQEWVSVTERLPEEDGSYLVTTITFGNRQGVKMRWFAKDGEKIDEYDLAGQKDVWYLYDSECGYVSIDSVTHWMPLPEPPKGE